MKIFHIAAAAATILMLFLHPAASGKEPAVRFVYDVEYEFRFDNREFSRTAPPPSITIFGMHLTPSIGLRISENPSSAHHIIAGVDLMKDFGSGKAAKDMFGEVLAYYKWDRKSGRTMMTFEAGIFPRSDLEGNWSEAFFSDSLTFYDRALEGLLLKFRRPKAYYEVGCDWMGQFGKDRRERFMIFSSGEAHAGRFMILGYSGYMYHFAGTEEVNGVVDNFLLNPYIGADLAGKTGLQAFRITAGWLQSLQNDRKKVGKYVMPGGAELLVSLQNWNIGLENRLYYGKSLMPYYDGTDAAGIKYGNMLYFGNPFYRLRRESSGKAGLYDRIDVCWEPRIAAFLKLRIGATAHFGSAGFSGWQQTVSLKFDLEKVPGVRQKP